MIEIKTAAPDFALPDQNGNTVRLSDFSGKHVVLYFYPKAMTPGCTTETCNFEQALPEFKESNSVVLGISKDSVVRQKKFADKNNVHFPLLSDEEGTVCKAFGVWQKKKLYGREFMGIVRSTFIIGPDGKIVKVYPKVKVKEHHLDVLNDLKTVRETGGKL